MPASTTARSCLASSSPSRVSSPAAGSSRQRSLRLRRESTRDPHQLALALGKVLRHRLRHRVEPEELQGSVRGSRTRDRPREDLLRRRPGRGAVRGDCQVLPHAQIVEQLDRLPGPGEPALGAAVRLQPVQQPCVQLDLPAVGHEPRDGVDERRLAGPVRPDQPHELTLPDLEVNLIERSQAAEVDGRSVRREDDGAWLASLRRLRGHTHGRDGRVGCLRRRSRPPRLRAASSSAASSSTPFPRSPPG